MQRHRTAILSTRAVVGPASAVSPKVHVATNRPNNRQVEIATLLAGIAISAAMTMFADVSAWSSVAALALVCAGGYLVGSRLVARTEELSLAIIRTVAGQPGRCCLPQAYSPPRMLPSTSRPSIPRLACSSIRSNISEEL
jgi:hypothetical protein